MNLKNIIQKEWRARNFFYVIMGILFLTWISFVWKGKYYNPAQLKKYGAYTVAEITEYGKYGKAQPVTRYRYKVGEKIYETSRTGWLGLCPDKDYCIGAKFTLLYSIHNPSIHKLLLNNRLKDSLHIGISLPPPATSTMIP